MSPHQCDEFEDMLLDIIESDVVFDSQYILERVLDEFRFIRAATTWYPMSEDHNHPQPISFREDEWKTV